MQQKLLESGVVSENVGYHLVLLYMEDESAETGMQALDDIRSRVGKTFMQALKCGKCTDFETGLRRLLFIVSEKDGAVKNEELLVAVQKAAKMTEDGIGIKLSILISGRLENGLCPCADIYTMLRDIMKLRAILGISGAELIIGNESESISEEMTGGIVQAIKDEDRKRYMDILNQILNEAGKYSCRNFIKWISAVSVAVQEIRNKISAKDNTGKKETTGDMPVFMTRDDIIRFFDALYNEAAGQISTVKKHSTLALMENAIDFIRSNYDDSNLNISLLAERADITPSYFGKLFREFAGCGASEYIVQIRMEKARDMILSDRNIDILKVAQVVGYSNSSYFTTAFKKHYGVPPAKLRDYSAVNRGTQQE